MKTKAIKVLIVMTVMATLLSACGSSKETDVASNQGGNPSPLFLYITSENGS